MDEWIRSYMGLMWRCQSAMAASEFRGWAWQWPIGHKPWLPHGDSRPELAQPIRPAWAHKRRALVAHSTHPPSPSPSRSASPKRSAELAAAPPQLRHNRSPPM